MGASEPLLCGEVTHKGHGGAEPGGWVSHVFQGRGLLHGSPSPPPPPPARGHLHSGRPEKTGKRGMVTASVLGSGGRWPTPPRGAKSSCYVTSVWLLSRRGLCKVTPLGAPARAVVDIKARFTVGRAQ